MKNPSQELQSVTCHMGSQCKLLCLKTKQTDQYSIYLLQSDGSLS